MLDLASETSTDTSKSVREAPSRAHEHAAPLNNTTHIVECTKYCMQESMAER